MPSAQKMLGHKKHNIRNMKKKEREILSFLGLQLKLNREF